MKRSLSADSLQETFARLSEANAALARSHPGDSGRRQPVHTVYGGAHLFRADTAARLGRVARRAMDEYAPDFAAFARALGLPGAESLPRESEGAARLEARLAADSGRASREEPEAWLAREVYARVREKLEREPVEVSASISKMATAIARMKKKTATPRPPPVRSPRALPPGSSRRLWPSASSRSPRNCASVACARWTSS
jgi:hypothetical protein